MVASYFNRFIRNGIPFMDGKTKGNIKDLVGDTIHIDDFGFIHRTDGEYAVIHVAEHPDFFYFGGLALTDMLAQVDADGMREELAQQGIVLTMKRSKNGRGYMAYEFVD